MAYQALGDGRHDTIWQEFTRARAIHRTDTDGISWEQAVDDAIARIKQLEFQRGMLRS